MSACPRCRATNPAGARWCGQCYETLDGAAPPGSPASRPDARAAPAPPAVAPAAAAPGTAPSAGPSGAGPVAYRRRDGELEWGCETCGTYNALGRSRCSVCATPFAARYRAGATHPTRATTPAVLALSAVLPGVGHVLCGQVGTGVARAVLFLVWCGGGLLLVLGGASTLVSGPLLAGALAVWAGTLYDVANLDTREPLLRGRALLWLVGGVTGLLLLGALAALAEVRAQGGSGLGTPPLGRGFA